MTSITAPAGASTLEAQPEGATPHAPGGRRFATVWRTVAVLYVALLFGALLDARGLHKTATIQPPGGHRDVAVAVTVRLVSVSSATRLDLLRSSVKDAIGRSGDDRISTTVALPAPAAGSRPTTTSRPPPGAKQKQPATSPKPHKPAPAFAYTRDHPLRVWTAGDSLVIAPAYAIERLVSRLPVRVLPVEGRVATGLERPDVYDWFARIRAVKGSLRGGVAVLAFGGNDDHPYMTGLPPNVKITSFWSAEWRREYGRRVGGVMDMLSSSRAHVVWIGLPMTRDNSRTERYAQLNAVVRREAQRRPASVTYVDTFWLLSDRGRYTEFLRTPAGKLVELREPDGIHFRPAAADLVAQSVLKALRGKFRLEGSA